MNKNIFISIDGNNTGSILQKYILSNELEKLSEFSSNLIMTIQYITQFIEKEKGKNAHEHICQSSNYEHTTTFLLSLVIFK